MNDSKQQERARLREGAVRDGALCRCRRDAPPSDHHPKCDRARGVEWTVQS